MRVGIDAGPVVASHGGVGLYVRHLIRSLVDRKSRHELRLYTPRGTSLPEDLRDVTKTGAASWAPMRWWNRRTTGKRDQLDVYHGTNFQLHTTGASGTVLTLHDLWLWRYPQYSKKLGGERWALQRLKRRVWSAQRVIAVSQSTARDLQEWLNFPSERIHVVHHGTPVGFYPDHNEPAWIKVKHDLGLPDKAYLLFVGGADPRKNHRLVCHAVSQAPAPLRDYPLIMVGSRQSRGDDLLETARAMGIAERVYCPGTVSRHVLRLLYSHATAFLFPSTYEGFGFPVLEAMACGAPVITSNVTALPEVAGDAAVFIHPHDETDVRKALLRIIEDGSFRRALIAKGLKQANRFTWQRTAEQTLAVYEELCA